MRREEEHITYDDKITGLVYIPEKKIYKLMKLHVRYSDSNISDSISFSDDDNFLVDFDVNSLKKLLEKYDQ